MFKRIAHVCLNVKDLDRSIAYYEKLGLTIVFRFTRHGAPYGVYMKISDGSFIEFFEEPGMGPVVNNGIVHFALETDDIDALAAKLAESGIVTSPKKLGVDNTWQTWLQDPDGNRFEIHQYTPQSMQFSGGTVEADW